MKIIPALTVVFMLFLLVTPLASAWAINPAKWIFYMKEEYEIKPITFDLSLTNNETAPITIQLSIMDPEYLYEGNTPIPDKSWIEISSAGTVEVPANSEIKVPIMINIPAEYTIEETTYSNYNKSYEAWILADQTAGPGNIQVDYRCRWIFQTPDRYVPLSERPGYINYPLYIIIIGIILFAAVACYYLYTRRSQKPSSTRTPKHKQKNKDDDIFK